MPEFFINGHSVQAAEQHTVMQAARAAGYFLPAFCWHPQLSAPGNCRVCVVEVRSDDDSSGWLDIACNMPVSAGMRVLTDSDKVRQRRQQTLQFATLNHPVDCGICDKAGECTLQDYHVAYNGAASTSIEPKLHAPKHVALSTRIVLDEERCILCTRCVRFTHEVSKSHGLGVIGRADHSAIRAVEDGAFERDAYSDNVIDLCPVGALSARHAQPPSRVWYLKATPSVCPGCARGCGIDIWQRKPEWHFKALDAERNRRIERVTPRENAAVNGPWICNTGRDLARTLERPRALHAMLKGEPVGLERAIEAARALIARAGPAVALVSSWASNEELAVFQRTLSARFSCYVKADRWAQAGETIEDTFLIQSDKNPNGAAARALFPPLSLLPTELHAALPDEAALVLVWGEGCELTQLPPKAAVIHLNSWQHADHSRADVFFPTSVMTERSGHYTNVAGLVGAFTACFPKPEGVVDASALFEALAPAPQEGPW